MHLQIDYLLNLVYLLWIKVRLVWMVVNVTFLCVIPLGHSYAYARVHLFSNQISRFGFTSER